MTLTAILEWSLRHRLAVVVAWAIVAVVGVVSALRLPIDAFPDTTPVQVQVNTTAPSLSPLEIERQITRPVEWALSGLPGLAEIRSVSKFGFSQVTATFDDRTDIHLARQVVAERLATVELPSGIDRPRLGPMATGLGEVFHYLVTGKGQSLAELRATQDWVIRPQLLEVPGVAEVNSWGGEERQLQVVVDPADLRRYDLSLEQLTVALEANNASVGGGVVESSGEASLVQGLGLVTKREDIEAIVVAIRQGVAIRVGDVARVAEGAEIRRGAVTADGVDEVVLGLAFLLPGENSHDVTGRLRLRLEEVRSSLPAGIEVTPVYERSTLVERVLRTVRTNLLEGALLVVAVLFVFLGNLRAGLIVAAAIPLSMLFAAHLMLRFGIAGSLMSLGAIDFGLVVDSSVIQVENVVRRLGGRDDARRPLDVVRDAVVEVRGPTLLGEAIIAIVYLPILTLEGVEGKLFRPMALTVLFALFGSMLLSLTLVPVLASFFLGGTRRPHESRFSAWLQARYRPLLGFALDRPTWVLGGAGLAVALAALLALRLGAEFVPRLSEGTLVANVVRLASVSLDESVRSGRQIERALLAKFPDELERVWTRSGSAEVATDPMGVELSDVFIRLAPRSHWTKAGDQDELMRRMSAELAGFPGLRIVFTQPIEMRMAELTAGIRSDIGVKIFGDDLDALLAAAERVQRVLRQVPGAADVVVEPVTGQPVIEIEIDRAAVAQHGISVAEVLATVEAIAPRKVGYLWEGERRFPIALRLDEASRSDIDAIGRILVSAANGDRIPLDRLATIHLEERPSTISREWGKRRVVVSANVRDRDLGGFVAEARRRLAAEVELPEGAFIRFGGQFEHLERARQRLAIVVPLAFALVFTLLYFTYGRAIDAGRVFTGVPFAAVGGVLALWLRGLPFSISAAVGFVALSGVAVLGDMVLVSTIRQLLERGRPLREAIEEAAVLRLRPVLMTALVASLGFVPMALSTGPGAEVQRPLATVVIGGVLSSAALTLLVLPVLYRVTRRSR